MTPTKTLAKSLHTITALQCVARYLIAEGKYLDPSDAIDSAAEILGYQYHAHSDPYSLKEKARATLVAEINKAALDRLDRIERKADVVLSEIMAARE